MSKLVVLLELSFSAQARIKVLLELGLVTSLSSDSDLVGEVVDVPIVVLSIAVDNVSVSLIIWHVRKEEADV